MSMLVTRFYNLSKFLKYPSSSFPPPPCLTQTTRQQHVPIYVTFVVLAAYTLQLEGLKGIHEGNGVYYVSV